MLKAGWPGPRITFDFATCPLCRESLFSATTHPLLQRLLGPIFDLYKDVRRKVRPWVCEWECEAAVLAGRSARLAVLCEQLPPRQCTDVKVFVVLVCGLCRR